MLAKVAMVNLDAGLVESTGGPWENIENEAVLRRITRGEFPAFWQT